MRMRAFVLMLLVPLLFSTVSCSSVPDDSTIPALFGKDVISTPLEEYRVSFTPDARTVYFARSRGFFPLTRQASILVSKYGPNGWSAPEVASFSGQYPDLDPFVTADGRRIYFSSIRPVDGTTRTDADLWYVEWTANGWSDPIHTGATINSPQDELYPSLDTHGNLYFGSDRPGGRGGWDIWRSAPSGQSWGVPENLENVNSASWDFNPAISPDGRYLVFTSIGRTENVGMGDLFASWANGPSWSVAVHLNGWVNSPADDYHASFSPDGQVLYFIRRHDPSTGGNVYAIPWHLIQP